MHDIAAIVVDDEPLARKRLKRMLKAHSDIRVVSECQNGREAVEAIRKNTPAVIFLDIQMPGLNAFDVIEQIGSSSMPLIVFVTAFSEHAIQAFEVNAADYLLKPFDEEKVNRAIKRVRERLSSGQSTESGLYQRLLRVAEQTREVQQYASRFLIKTKDRSVFVRVEKVDWIEAAGKYARLYCGKEYQLLRQSMHELEKQLDPLKFARIHRSIIVNLDSIREFQQLFHGELLAVLNDGTELTVSRRYRSKLDSRVHGSL